MSWVKRALWLPEGMDQETWYREENPMLIVCRHANWGLVHDEIQEENPDYPIVLTAPLSPLYGMRVRGVEVRHTPISEYPQWDLWWEKAVLCRIAPS